MKSLLFIILCSAVCFAQDTTTTSTTDTTGGGDTTTPTDRWRRNWPGFRLGFGGRFGPPFAPPPFVPGSFTPNPYTYGGYYYPPTYSYPSPVVGAPAGYIAPTPYYGAYGYPTWGPYGAYTQPWGPSGSFSLSVGGTGTTTPLATGGLRIGFKEGEQVQGPRKLCWETECGEGEQCCDDTLLGALCYNTTKHHCMLAPVPSAEGLSQTLAKFGGDQDFAAQLDETQLSRLCEPNQEVCYLTNFQTPVCYDPTKFECVFSNQTVCNIGDQVCADSRMGIICYNQNTHKCIENNYLCAIADEICHDIRLGPVCYSPATHKCTDLTMGDTSELGMFGRAGAQLMSPLQQQPAAGQMGGASLAFGGSQGAFGGSQGAFGGSQGAFGGSQGGLAQQMGAGSLAGQDSFALGGQMGTGSLGLESGSPLPMGGAVGTEQAGLLPQADMGQGMGMGQAMGLASNLKMLCGIRDDSCWDSVIGPVCYSMDTHKCINKRTLCGINDDVCGVICFDSRRFRCDNGRILAIEDAAMTGGAQTAVQPAQQFPSLPVQQPLPTQTAVSSLPVAPPVQAAAPKHEQAAAKPSQQLPAQQPAAQIEKPAQGAAVKPASTGMTPTAQISHHGLSETDLRRTHGEPHIIECKSEDC